MLSATVLVFLVLAAQIHGNEIANRAVDNLDLTAKQVDTLTDRLANLFLHLLRLQHVTMGKPVGFRAPAPQFQMAGSQKRSPSASRPRISGRFLRRSPAIMATPELTYIDLSDEDEVSDLEWDSTSTAVLDFNPALALGPEVDDEGGIEYKRHLVDPSRDRFDRLVTQLKWRLFQGQGEALYELGVEDDGTLLGLTDAEMSASYETLKKMAAELDADVSIMCERKGKEGITRTALVRERLAKQSKHVGVKITTVGNVDSGKSTLLGVLTKGTLDDGRGLARSSVLRFKHEAESGRTSAISEQILGFSADGRIINYDSEHTRESESLPWTEIVPASSKVVSFFDLAGHEKYFRTTLYGLTGVLPDYAMMVIDSNRGGVRGMTREHLTVVLSLRVPLFVVITKVDMSSEDLVQQTLDEIMMILKRQGVQKVPFVVRNEADVLTACRNIAGNTVTPIFLTSAVSGDSLDLLRLFLNHAPARQSWEKDGGGIVHINERFQVSGIGTVVTGNLVSGTVTANKDMLLGPDMSGEFKEVRVASIQNNCVGVQRVEAGQFASFAIKARREVVHKEDIRKGMVLVEKNLHPQATWFFTAEVLILVHPTTMKLGFSPVVHCLTVRQSARIMNMTSDLLRSGDRATVTFQWCHWPEYLREGSRIVFREGRTKGIGVVKEIFPSKPRRWYESNKLVKQMQPEPSETSNRQKKKMSQIRKGNQKEGQLKKKRNKGNNDSGKSKKAGRWKVKKPKD